MGAFLVCGMGGAAPVPSNEGVRFLRAPVAGPGVVQQSVVLR